MYTPNYTFGIRSGDIGNCMEPASRTDRFELPVYRLKESFVEFLLILNSPHPLNSTHHDDRPVKRESRAIHPHNVQIYTYTAQNRFPVCVP